MVEGKKTISLVKKKKKKKDDLRESEVTASRPERRKE